MVCWPCSLVIVFSEYLELDPNPDLIWSVLYFEYSKTKGGKSPLPFTAFSLNLCRLPDATDTLLYHLLQLDLLLGDRNKGPL